MSLAIYRSLYHFASRVLMWKKLNKFATIKFLFKLKVKKVNKNQTQVHLTNLTSKANIADIKV